MAGCRFVQPLETSLDSLYVFFLRKAPDLSARLVSSLHNQRQAAWLKKTAYGGVQGGARDRLQQWGLGVLIGPAEKQMQ